MNNIYNFDYFLNENIKWTQEMLQAEADKYKTRREFQLDNNAAYKIAVNQKILDELFKNHKNKGYYKNYRGTELYWTKEKLQKEVNKYTKRKDFLKNNHDAYASAVTQNLLDELFKNHPNQGYSKHSISSTIWTEDMLQAEADKYKTRGEFFIKDINAYHAAVNKKLIDKLFKNHPNQGYSNHRKKSGYWTEEKLQDEANKY